MLAYAVSLYTVLKARDIMYPAVFAEHQRACTLKKSTRSKCGIRGQTMSKEQIEIPTDEMGASGYSKLAWELWHKCNLPMTQCDMIDRIVREQGYHKKNEAEWVKVYQNKVATVYECSHCNHLTMGTSDYCICGAHMKGEGNE
jgi:hypothetical protein